MAVSQVEGAEEEGLETGHSHAVGSLEKGIPSD